MANGKFTLLLVKGSPYISSKFNLLYKDTPLIRTHGPLISFLISFLSVHPAEE